MPERPVALLIAALGGEGGGVLTNWIVEAASRAGHPVQSTSIPGVAQRTGATTYYIEVDRRPQAAGAAREPVMTLTPGPGDIDVMVASELLEAGRALENGYVTPERTTLIASTHRIYAVVEKSAMADGRYPAAGILAAAAELSQRAILLDFGALARESGSIVNAVLLGAIAATGKLPFEERHLEDAVRASAIAVEANLAGFRLGRERALEAPAPQLPEDASAAPGRPAGTAPAAELGQRFPDLPPEIPAAGLAKVVDYQDAAYGRLYLDRLGRIVEAAGAGGDAETLLLTVARCLANWMAYEDTVRVADLKTRPERFRRIRREVRAGPDEPLHIVDYLKPGPEELTALLPGVLARPILRWTSGSKRLDRWHLGMHVRTSSLPGFLLLRAMAGCRRLRRFGHRYQEEQAAIEAWLALVAEAKSRDLALATEIAECARLIRGYGETHRRGRANFRRIMADVVRPGLAAGDPATLAMRVRMAREAALSDPEGKALDAALKLAAE